MSNACSNYLVITGSSKEIKRFVKATTKIVKLLDGTMSSQPCFCFDALVPAPPNYSYDWACKHWGCNYDVEDAEITAEDMEWHEGCHKIQLLFQTPWTPPCKWMIQASRAFPTLTFRMESKDFLMVWREDYFAKGGRMRRKKYTQEECSELLKSYWE